MKHFHRNLLVMLAAALCGLCLYQWRDQVAQRQAITTLNQLVYDRDAALQKATNSVAVLSRQVDQFDAELASLQRAAETNAALMADQKRELGRVNFLNRDLTNQVAQYQQAVTTLEAKLQEAAADITKENDLLKQLTAQRDALVKKYNDEVKDRNTVVAKYNELVEQIKKAQAAQTNQ
jgi:chromosome segregation ATPase